MPAPAQLQVRMGALDADLVVPATSWFAPIRAAFLDASGGRLTLAASRHGHALPRDVVAPTATDLQDALAAVAPSNILGDVRQIGLLFARRWSGASDVLGLMFDADIDPESGEHFDDPNSIAREGCIIFTEAIERYCQGPPARDFATYLVRTAVHELGHVFNLEHDPSGRSYMAQTRDAIYPTAFSAFSQADAHFMRTASPYQLLPGGANFGAASHYDRALPDVPPSRRALRLELSAAQSLLVPGQALVPDMELAPRPGVHATYAVPDELDPGYDRMRVWVERPDGERWRVRFPRLYCRPTEVTRLVSADAPLTNNLTILRSGRRLVFDRPGRYGVWCEFDLRDAHGRRERLTSNRLTVEVATPAQCERRGWREASRFLRRPDVMRFLEARGEVDAPRTRAQVAAFVHAHDEPVLTDLARYALVRGAWAAADRSGRPRRLQAARFAPVLDRLARSRVLSRGSKESVRRMRHALE